MRARLTPLRSKYYETVVECGDVNVSIRGGSGRASDREIESAGFTLDQYERNDVVNEWGFTAKEMIHDSNHYEKQDVYEAALKILEVLNEG